MHCASMLVQWKASLDGNLHGRSSCQWLPKKISTGINSLKALSMCYLQVIAFQIILETILLDNAWLFQIVFFFNESFRTA